MNIKSALWEAIPLPRSGAYVVAKIGTAAVQFYAAPVGVFEAHAIPFAGRAELATVFDTAATAERVAAKLNLENGAHS